MLEPWIHVAVVVFLLFSIFIAGAYYQKRIAEVPRILGRGAVMGIVFGVPLDLIVGKYFGLYIYTLGFTPTFLVVNWVILNGLFAANTLLGQRLRLPYFFLWTLVLMVVHEVPNHFFRVWTWQFSFPPVEYVLVLTTGYFLAAIVGAIVWRVCFGYEFALLPTKR